MQDRKKWFDLSNPDRIIGLTSLIFALPSFILFMRGYMSVEIVLVLILILLAISSLLYRNKYTDLKGKFNKSEDNVATYKDKETNCKEKLKNEKSNFEKELAKAQEKANNYDMLHKMEENARKKLEDKHKELEKRFKKSEEENRKLKGELNKNYLVEVESASYEFAFNDQELKKLTPEETLAMMEEKRKQGALNFEDSIKAIDILKGIIGIK